MICLNLCITRSNVHVHYHYLIDFRQKNLHQRRWLANIQGPMEVPNHLQVKKGKSPSKSRPKAHKREISAEKVRSQENDRMSALILVSTGDLDDYTGLPPLDSTDISTPKDDTASLPPTPQDDAALSRPTLQGNGVSSLEDTNPLQSSVGSTSSSFPFSHFHTSGETPRR